MEEYLQGHQKYKIPLINKMSNKEAKWDPCGIAECILISGEITENMLTDYVWFMRCDLIQLKMIH